MAQSSPIGIIAGNGKLPLEAAQALSAAGETVFVLGIDGEASSELKEFGCDYLRWGQIGQFFALLKEQGVERILMAGGIARKPDLKSVGLPDLETLRNLPDILASAFLGDDTALTKVVRLFEKRGFQVVGFRTLLPQLLVSEGANGKIKANTRDVESLGIGATVARMLGPFDIGQSVVVVGQRVVAVEGAEGTDAMLERVEQLRKIGRLPSNGGLLVKCFKPGQEERVDLPAIGPMTIANAHAAGLKGIGVDAGFSLIVERERTLRRAQDLGVFVYGLQPEKTEASR